MASETYSWGILVLKELLVIKYKVREIGKLTSEQSLVALCIF